MHLGLRTRGAFEWLADRVRGPALNSTHEILSAGSGNKFTIGCFRSGQGWLKQWLKHR
jgi:hypothetical protein